MDSVIHPTYLPFEAEALERHFARVSNGFGDPDRHLKYYRESARRNQEWLATRELSVGPQRLKPRSLDVQIEKDERFWVVTALLSLFGRGHRVNNLAGLLTRGLEGPEWVGFSSWSEALGSEQQLLFEANFPSPESYRRWLARHVDERVLTRAAREAAAGSRLEGPTKVDAVLVADTGFTVLFEAKVLSDVSTSISYDVLRNQLARTIDVALERPRHADPDLSRRDRDKTCVVLLTPEIFKSNPSSRLYGHLYHDYRTDPSLLAEHLQHRTDVPDWSVVARRLGWATWEDCNEVLPGSLTWLEGTMGAANA